MHKIKVLVLCHFSNNEIRKKLPLSNLFTFNVLRKIRGLTTHSYSDFAPWVTNQIKEFEKFDNLELHIVSPHLGLTRFIFNFEMNGVFYHFYQSDLPFIHFPYYKIIPGKGIKRFFFIRYLVKSIIKRINPDIVNLIGTENPYYSITALDIRNIPIYASVQTVYTNPQRREISGQCIELNWNVEILLHKKIRYYGCTGRMHRDLILKNNPNAIVFRMVFPVRQPKELIKLPKKFDFVFFAGIAKKKGVEDLLIALSIVKKWKNNVVLNIVGKTNPSYNNYLSEIIINHNLKDNVVFTDYFPEHDDLLQHVVQSHIAVLPVKMDIIPGSVIEAMHLELPVITYKTTGTPMLNKYGEAVMICDVGDIEQLAKNMVKLLEDQNLRKSLIKNSKVFLSKELDNQNNARTLYENYLAVIDHFSKNKEIPEDMLFNPSEFPEYNIKDDDKKN